MNWGHEIASVLQPSNDKYQSEKDGKMTAQYVCQSNVYQGNFGEI